jgi:D-glycero-D-manno-heptose 1,7-bisphosphate phosphatase
LNRPAVFLDRDGTIIEDVGYLDALERIVWYPWSVDAIRALNHAGFPVVVITNQAGVARGYFAEAFVHDVHRALDAYLAAGGARVDAYYHCPHHPNGSVPEYRQECACRKPGCGMIQRAARELGLDPARSIVVGDAWTDIGAARAAGARALLVRPGGRRLKDKRGSDAEPDAVVDHLAAAASWILTHVDRA